MHKPFISIVIPTYNERENICRLIDKIQEGLISHQINGTIIIVDDASPDGTGEIAEELSRKYGNINVIHRLQKSGIGSAYIEGFRSALGTLKAEIIFEMDADLSHDPVYIPSFIEKFGEGFDVVVGTRYVPGGEIQGWAYTRRMMSWGANFLTRKLLGLKVHDATSGFRGYTSSTLRKLDLESIKSEGYAFQVEMLFRCSLLHLKIGEIPIVFVDRRFGKSKLSKRDVFSFFRVLISLFFERIKRVFA